MLTALHMQWMATYEFSYPARMHYRNFNFILLRLLVATRLLHGAQSKAYPIHPIYPIQPCRLCPYKVS